MGPIGAVLAVVLIVVLVAVVFFRRPSVSWAVYVDADGGVRIEHPDDWVAQDLSGMDEDLGPVAGVGVTAGDALPSSFRDSLQSPFDAANYGLLVFRLTGQANVTRVLAALDVPPSLEPHAAGLAGLDGQQVTETRSGVWRRTVYAEGSGRLVVFFARVPVAELDSTQGIVQHAEDSARFVPMSGGGGETNGGGKGV